MLTSRMQISRELTSKTQKILIPPSLVPGLPQHAQMRPSLAQTAVSHCRHAVASMRVKVEASNSIVNGRHLMAVLQKRRLSSNSRFGSRILSVSLVSRKVGSIHRGQEDAPTATYDGTSASCWPAYARNLLAESEELTQQSTSFCRVDVQGTLRPVVEVDVEVDERARCGRKRARVIGQQVIPGTVLGCCNNSVRLTCCQQIAT